MPTSTFENPDGSITHFTRDDSTRTVEDLRLAPGGKFISRTVYRYDAYDRMEEYVTYDQDRIEVGRVSMSYGPGPWDAQSLELGRGGILLRRIQHTFDYENHCKARLYYSGAGEYLGRAVEKLDDDGVFRGPKYYDKD